MKKKGVKQNLSKSLNNLQVLCCLSTVYCRSHCIFPNTCSFSSVVCFISPICYSVKIIFYKYLSHGQSLQLALIKTPSKFTEQFISSSVEYLRFSDVGCSLAATPVITEISWGRISSVTPEVVHCGMAMYRRHY